MPAPRLVAALGLLVFTALPALSAECERWKAGVWDVEGGRAMTAHVCAPVTDGDREAMLYLQCGEPGMLALSYDDGGRGDPPGGNPEWSGPVVISSDAGKREETFVYQAMDGTLFLPLPQDGPVLAMVKSGSSITLAPREPAFGTRTFTLSGSSAALAKLASTCGRN